jgi:Tol biopolymer transport system component
MNVSLSVSLCLCVFPLLACTGTDAAAPAAVASGAEPAGYALVYERTVDGNQDLYVAPAGGGVERRITDHPATDALPRWTRDGSAVLFGSDRSGNWQLYSVGPRGGEPRRLRQNGWREWQLDGSPDGASIAFLSNKEGAEYLLTAGLDGGTERVLVRHGKNSILGNPTWSPDGGRIVFSSNWKVGHAIYVVNADGSGEERLSAYRRGGCEPRFSPDGRKVLYVSRGFLSKNASRLVERDLASGQEKVLVDWPALNYNPVYSPDQSEVAFTSNITGEWVVYRQRIADGKSWRVTFGPGAARGPDYRPLPRR